MNSRNRIWQLECSGIRSCRSDFLVRGRIAQAIRSACWKCRRRLTSNGTRIGEVPPGLPSDGILRIATSVLDVPAETIAVLDEHRWTIEILFRFFKHLLVWRAKSSCSPLVRNERHSLWTRDELPREPGVIRQSETG